MGFWKKLWHGIKGIGEWLEYMLGDELKQFIMDNRGLAIDIVVKTATEMAKHPADVKWSLAWKFLRAQAMASSPDIKVHNFWIDTLLQLAYAVARSQKLIEK